MEKFHVSGLRFLFDCIWMREFSSEGWWVSTRLYGVIFRMKISIIVYGLLSGMVLQCRQYFHPFKVGYYKKCLFVLSDEIVLFSTLKMEALDLLFLWKFWTVAQITRRHRPENCNFSRWRDGQDYVKFCCSELNSHRRPTLPATGILVQLSACSKVSL